MRKSRLPGREAAECFIVPYDLAEAKYAFPVGEFEIAVVPPDISQAL